MEDWEIALIVVGVCVVFVILLIAAFKLWYKATTGVCRSTRRLDGLTALVTGANSGIGLETARDLARRGARVLLACRDPQRGQHALAAVRAAATGNASVKLLSLDLESLASVRACAVEVIASEPRLDILVNNAGAGFLGNGQTADGLHRSLQVNHFGSFLLTLLLVDLLKKSAPSRVVFVTTVMHRFVTIQPEQLDHARAKDLNEWTIYCLSKLASVIAAKELARRLRGTGVAVNSLHPGVTRTNVFRHLPFGAAPVMNLFTRIFCKTAVEGAQTSIHLAVSEEVEGVTGCYFSDCKEARMASQAHDDAVARAVWRKSVELVALRDDEKPALAD